MKRGAQNAITEIRMISYECNSFRNDGFTAFGYKQDLYLIKEAIDQALASAPKFVGEEEWLQEQEKKRIIKILQS